MKQLTCELCGSIDLVKQDGHFVCQFCGCKYSPEEAKKMMIEGTVEVQGTVSIDNSALLKKYLENARRAMQKEDWEEAERYYNKLEENDPTNIEAIFYSSYAKAHMLLWDSEKFKRQHAFEILNKTLSIIDDNYTPEKLDVVIKIDEDIKKLSESKFVYQGNDGLKLVLELFKKLHSTWVETLSCILEKTVEESEKNRICELIVYNYEDSDKDPLASQKYKIADKWLSEHSSTYREMQATAQKRAKLEELKTEESRLKQEIKSIEEKIYEAQQGKRKGGKAMFGWGIALLAMLVVSFLAVGTSAGEDMAGSLIVSYIFILGVPGALLLFFGKRKLSDFENIDIEADFPRYRKAKQELREVQDAIDKL